MMHKHLLNIGRFTFYASLLQILGNLSKLEGLAFYTNVYSIFVNLPLTLCLSLPPSHSLSILISC
jgi:hypothetical protein